MVKFIAKFYEIWHGVSSAVYFEFGTTGLGPKGVDIREKMCKDERFGFRG